MGQKNKYGLTDRQNKYCLERAKGKTQRQAYKAAYPNNKSKDVTIDQAACRLETNSNVIARLEMLRAMDNNRSIAGRDDIAKDLSIIASDVNNSLSNRLKAYDQLARLQGCYSDGPIVNVNQSVITATDKSKAIAAYLQDLTNTK